MYYNCLFRKADSYADNLNKDYEGEAYFGITDMAKAFTTTTTKPTAFTKKDVTLYPDNSNPGI